MIDRNGMRRAYRIIVACQLSPGLLSWGGTAARQMCRRHGCNTRK